jgi:AmmeMemoRadiSam system protein A/AmmeMemoRadiSam system protein B
VPHAGYAFSGEVAAAAFREVERGVRRIFLLAANHNGRAPFSGVSLPQVTHYAIPGAMIPLSAVVGELQKDALFTHEPGAHTMHMIEVELPFLHHLHGRSEEPNYTIVPMILGHMDEGAVDHLATVLDSYADPDTLFVFSVDLSHFYPYARARELDRYTVDAIMSRDRRAIARAVTDGNQVLETMLALADRHGWETTLGMARNSGDVSGNKNRVVGYASVLFHRPFFLTRRERQELLGLARQFVEERVRHDRGPEPDEAWLDRHPRFRIPRGVFVTLEKEGRLRGCMGDIVGQQPLYVGVRNAAIRAAVADPRFRPVTEDELGDLAISISVLEYPSRVNVSHAEEYLDVLRPLKDGVILVHEGKRSTFLPQVWEDIPDPQTFLSRLALKQGSPADAWRSPSTVLYRYGAYVFGEDEPSS